MKNITAFAVLVIITSTLTVKPALCQEKERNFRFSFGPQFGFVHGQALEVVYPVDTKGRLLSELLWDMKPVFYYGAVLDFGPAESVKSPAFFSSLSFKAGVPNDSGIMEDRDWQSTENAALTNFSSHTNRTREFYWLDVKAGVSLPVKSLFYIKPFLSGSWSRFSFTGRDGYAKYAREKIKGSATYFPIDDNPNVSSFTGDVIRYTQDWFLIAAGFTVGIKFLSNFSFDLSFQISPLTFCGDTDEHLLTDTVYRDTTRWGLFLGPGGKLSYNLQRLELSLEFTYRYIGETAGETYINQNDSGYFSSTGKAGAGLSFTDTAFMVTVHF
jgi:outer membrane protease